MQTNTAAESSRAMFQNMRDNPPPPYQRQSSGVGDNMLMPAPRIEMKKPCRMQIQDVKDAGSALEYYNQAIASMNKVKIYINNYYR